MPGSMEDRIKEIVESRRSSPLPATVSYLVWGLVAVVVVGFSILLLFVVFILLRTAFLYGFAQLTGS